MGWSQSRTSRFLSCERAPDVLDVATALGHLGVRGTERNEILELATNLYAHTWWHAATPATDYGWIGGHAHEIALPLVTTHPPAPNPLSGTLPTVTNTHGHLPATPEAAWISAKLFTHPERIGEIITAHLPGLLTSLDEPTCWWLRYRSPRETDHLRLRLHTTPGRYAQPVITAYPAGTADEDLPIGLVVDKHHVRMVFTP